MVVMTVSASMIMRLALRAARHSEIGLQRNVPALPAIDLRDRANHDAGVEDLVVEREIVRRMTVTPSAFWRAQLAARKAATVFDKSRLVRFARPEGFRARASVHGGYRCAAYERADWKWGHRHGLTQCWGKGQSGGSGANSRSEAYLLQNATLEEANPDDQH